jgi:hypothetical protein
VSAANATAISFKLGDLRATTRTYFVK